MRRFEQGERIEAKECTAEELKKYKREILEIQQLIEKYRSRRLHIS
jgi:hypothetical protein